MRRQPAIISGTQFYLSDPARSAKPRVVLMCCTLCKFGAEAVKPKPISVPAFPVTIRTQQLHRRRHQAARIPNCGKDGTPVRAHFAKTFPATARQDPPLRFKSGPRCASEKQTHPRAHEPPCGRSCVLYRARPVATRWRCYAVYVRQQAGKVPKIELQINALYTETFHLAQLL